MIFLNMASLKTVTMTMMTLWTRWVRKVDCLSFIHSVETSCTDYSPPTLSRFGRLWKLINSWVNQDSVRFFKARGIVATITQLSFFTFQQAIHLWRLLLSGLLVPPSFPYPHVLCLSFCPLRWKFRSCASQYILWESMSLSSHWLIPSKWKGHDTSLLSPTCYLSTPPLSHTHTHFSQYSLEKIESRLRIPVSPIYEVSFFATSLFPYSRHRSPLFSNLCTFAMLLVLRVEAILNCWLSSSSTPCWRLLMILFSSRTSLY